MTKYLQVAKNIALKSTNVTYHHAALVIYKGRIISSSYNKEGFNNHAEIESLRKVRKKINWNKVTLLVIRISKTSLNILNSKPCTICYNYIKRLGINKIIYSGDESKLERVRTNELEGKTRYSKGQNYLYF